MILAQSRRDFKREWIMRNIGSITTND